MVEIRKAVEEQVGSLGKGEEVLGSYECRIDAMRGFLVCTTNGIKFIQGGGKYDKVFQKLFDIPYDMVKVGKEANTYLVLTIEGYPYRKRLEPVGGPISVLEKIISPYIEITHMPSPRIMDMRVSS